MAAQAYTVTASNSAGNATVSLSITVNAAVTAPTTPVVSAPANVTANATGLTASVPTQPGSTYAWSVTGGTITAGQNANQVTFTAGASGTVQLACVVTNAAGSTSQAGTAACVIVASPMISSFGAVPDTITTGSSSILTCSFSGGMGTINQGIGTASSGGSYTVKPSTTTSYTLTVTNAIGTSVAKTVTVTLVPVPVITGFTAGPGSIDAGSVSILSYSFTGGTGSINQGVGSVFTGGTTNVAPMATTIFTLTVTNPAGSWVTMSATVTVVPLPVISGFSSSPSPLPIGTSATLTPTFSNGAGSIDHGIGTVGNGEVKSTGNLTSPVTYTLTVTNANGTSVTATAPITISQGVFTPTNTPPFGPDALVKLPDGRILAMGGGSSAGSLYDSNVGTWASTTGTMPMPRSSCTATLLPNGKVLVAGGASVGASAVSTTELFDPATGAFTDGGSMTVGREWHSATLLSNGRVLIAGGAFTPGTSGLLATAEIYDPVLKTFTATGSLTTPRTNHNATLLSNGQVLITGDGGGELYDPTSGTFTATKGNMVNYRSTCTATLLSNGRVLIAGGSGSTAELFDPSTGTFSATGSMAITRKSPTATLLPDGMVLLAGGSSTLAPGELYNPAVGVFAPTTGTMNSVMVNGQAVALPNGWVLLFESSYASMTSELFNPQYPAPGVFASVPLTSPLVGPLTVLSNGLVLAAGTGLFDPASNTVTNIPGPANGVNSSVALRNGLVLVAGGSGAALFNPATSTYTATGSMITPRSSYSTTLLPDGRVLFAGGTGASGPLASAELFDPATGTFTATGSMNAARYSHSATLLPNGLVLIAGGTGPSYTELASAELYNPSSGTFGTTGSMVIARGAPTAVLLPNGLVMVLGYWKPSSLPPFPMVAELYSPTNGAFTATAVPDTLEGCTGTVLPSGSVLLAGGRNWLFKDGTAAATLYNPFTGATQSTGSMKYPRYPWGTGAVLMPNGFVLVDGGQGLDITSNLEVYR